MIICLRTVISFHIFLSDTNNFQMDLFNQLRGSSRLFLSITYNYMVSSNNFYSIIVICWPTVIWFQVTNNYSYMVSSILIKYK